MSWQTPKTWTAGSSVTAAELNQEVRDNLDALRAERVVGGYTEGNWTPTGNGVLFATATGTYTKIGRAVIITGAVQWPTTTDTSEARIASLPFTPVSAGGLSVGYTTAAGTASISWSDVTLHVEAYTAYVTLRSLATGAGLLNSALSDKWVQFAGVYNAI